MKARVVLACLLVGSMFACTPKAATYQATLYFADRDLRVLVPVARPLTSTPEALPAAIVAGLQQPPQGLTSVLPADTTIERVVRDGDTVSVDLRPAHTGLQGAAMVQEALALSLAGLDGIDRVRMLGLPQGEAGIDFSVPTPRPAYPNRWLDANEADGTWITVAWQLRDLPYLVPVSVPAASDSVAERLAVWQKGPTGSRARVVTGLWPNEVPLGLIGQNGQTVAIALPQKWPQVAWGQTMRALSWTLTEAPGVEHVELKGDRLPPGVPADGRLDRPQALNADSSS